MNPPDIGVADHPEHRRYEISVDGRRAGFATYRLAPGVITFQHTEVDPDVGRQGLGTQLVREALDDARRRRLAVRPLCPFVADFIERNPEYADLVTPG
jgi:predicted GNAT family acetyltransferase